MVLLDPFVAPTGAAILKVLTSVAGVSLIVAGLAYMFDQRIVSPAQISAWMVFSATLLCSVRYIAMRVIDRLTLAGRLVRRTVIVGGGKDANDLIRKLNADPANHMKILGVFDDRQEERVATSKSGIAQPGTFEKLSGFCSDMGVDLLIVTVPVRAEERLMQILQKLFTLQADIRVSALNSKLRLNSRAYSYIGRVPMLAVMDKPLSDWDRVLKNMEDRIVGALLLVLLSPVMALTAIAIRFSSKGPVFFRQNRYGFNNELIEVYKFRSMYVDRQDATASKLVTRDDPRPSAVNPSPSTSTARSRAAATSRCTAATVVSARPRPGPMTMAPTRSSDSPRAASHSAPSSRARPTASVGRPGS